MDCTKFIKVQAQTDLIEGKIITFVKISDRIILFLHCIIMLQFIIISIKFKLQLPLICYPVH